MLTGRPAVERDATPVLDNDALLRGVIALNARASAVIVGDARLPAVCGRDDACKYDLTELQFCWLEAASQGPDEEAGRRLMLSRKEWYFPMADLGRHRFWGVYVALQSVPCC